MILQSRKGWTINSPHSDDEASARLTKIVESGELRNDPGFAIGMIRKQKAGRLSNEQRFWLHKLVLDAERKNDKPVCRLPRVAELMANALANGLRYPKIRLTNSLLVYWSERASEVRVRGPRRCIVGRLRQDGGFVSSGISNEDLRILQTFDRDPADAARIYGIETSQCCFCGRELTTTESVSAGYGPICAGKFGLPWGAGEENYEEALRRKKRDQLKREIAALQRELKEKS